MNEHIIKNIAIIGAGAWGIALALSFNRKGHKVTIWSYSKQEIIFLRKKREHGIRLPGINIPKNLIFTNLIKDLTTCEIFFLVTPAQKIKTTCKKITNIIKNQPIVLCSKGIDLKSEKLLSQIIKEEIPNNKLFVLSGPSFAVEVAHNKFTAATLAGEKLKDSILLSNILSSNNFRLYASDDIKGVEIGGAFKNVLAIGAGIISGLGMGKNAHAAFITRGVHEMICLGLKLGAQRKTFSGLSGIGDLVLSCTSPLSRNHSLGIDIGQTGGRNKQNSNLTLTEGAYTTKAIYNLSKKLNIDLPLSKSIYKILYENYSPNNILNILLSKPINKEFNM